MSSFRRFRAVKLKYHSGFVKLSRERPDCLYGGCPEGRSPLSCWLTTAALFCGGRALSSRNSAENQRLPHPLACTSRRAGGGLWGPRGAPQSGPDRRCSSLFSHVEAFRRILISAPSIPKQLCLANCCFIYFCNPFLKFNLIAVCSLPSNNSLPVRQRVFTKLLLNYS